MNVSKLNSIERIEEFLAGTTEIVFGACDDGSDLRNFVTLVMKQFSYARREKKERGILFAYMERVTGYSRAHLSRLILQYRDTKTLKQKTRASRTSFTYKYGTEDVALLAQTDRLHDTLSGPATKVLFIRALTLFGDIRFANLVDLSVSHLYNLRASAPYQKLRVSYKGTRPSPVAIGVRKAPNPQGLPGYIRIDTVHQGDHDGVKGVYHINAVDIVTQWELAACVEHISEAYLLPVIELLLAGFPFVIRGFHSDSGSEYLNRPTAQLLNKLHIEFTRSRPRHTNDNALVESKNGAIIRKSMGYAHIPQKHAAIINRFYTDVFNPYLNFHRPCYFSVDKKDAKGKIRKTYPHNEINTPWERLKTLPNYETNLRPGVTTHALEGIANAMSDNDAAQHMQKARTRLFESITAKGKTAI